MTLGCSPTGRCVDEHARVETEQPHDEPGVSVSEGTRHRAMTEAALRECQKLCQQARLNGQHALDRARRAEQARDQAESRIHQLEGRNEELEAHWGRVGYAAWGCLVGADSVTSLLASRHASLFSDDTLRELQQVSADCRKVAERLKPMVDAALRTDHQSED